MMVLGGRMAAWCLFFGLIISISSSMVAAQHRRSGRWHLKRISQRSILSGMQRLTHHHDDQPFIPKSTSRYPVNLYVVDSGVRITHEEFGNRAELGANFATRTRDNGKEMDCQGHGTSVAALAAGEYSGIARTARIISVRVLDCRGTGFCTDVVRALAWVTKDIIARENRTRAKNSPPHARSVIVMSLGSSNSGCSPTRNQTRTLVRMGVPIFAAAGNAQGNSCKFYPARNADVMSVGATDVYDRIYENNNYGKCIDLWAPGVRVVSAWGNVSNNEYKTISGTSFAAPFVAGTAALILGADNTLSVSEVRRILMDSATLNKVRKDNYGNILSGSRFLYTPWAKLFDDVPRNGAEDDSDRAKRWTMYALDLTPRVTPAMAHSVSALKRACKLNCTRGTIEMRRVTHAYNNGTEPRVIRLHIYMKGCGGNSANGSTDSIDFEKVKRDIRENISLRATQRNVKLPLPIYDRPPSKTRFELDSLSILLLAVLGWILLLFAIGIGTGCWKKKIGPTRHGNRNRTRSSNRDSNDNAPKSQDDEEQADPDESSTNSAGGHSVVAISPSPQ